MRHIEVVAESFAIVEDKQVLGVVTKINESQWAFYAMVPGHTNGITSYVPLQHALEEAMKFTRS